MGTWLPDRTLATFLENDWYEGVRQSGPEPTFKGPEPTFKEQRPPGTSTALSVRLNDDSRVDAVLILAYFGLATTGTEVGFEQRYLA